MLVFLGRVAASSLHFSSPETSGEELQATVGLQAQEQGQESLCRTCRRRGEREEGREERNLLVLGIILITDCDLRQANHKADAPVLLVCDWECVTYEPRDMCDFRGM